MPVLLMFLRYDYSRNRRRVALGVREWRVGDPTPANPTRRFQIVRFDAPGWGWIERGLSALCGGPESRAPSRRTNIDSGIISPVSPPAKHTFSLWKRFQLCRGRVAAL